MRLTDFDALTFDCYGTLIDWESGMIEALKGLTERAGRPLTRDQILEAHGRHEASQEAYTPAKLYRDLLAIVYKRLAEEWGVHATHEECVAYGRSIRNWPAFADSPGALQYLKKHFKLVILSNVDNESPRRDYLEERGVTPFPRQQGNAASEQNVPFALRLAPQLLLMRLRQFGHAVEREVHAGRLTGVHGRAEALLRMAAVDPA